MSRDPKSHQIRTQSRIVVDRRRCVRLDLSRGFRPVHADTGVVGRPPRAASASRQLEKRSSTAGTAMHPQSMPPPARRSHLPISPFAVILHDSAAFVAVVSVTEDH